MTGYCCVDGCKRNCRKDKEHSFFQFPHNPKTRSEWIRFAAGVNGNVSKSSRICSDHFEEKCIYKKYPRPLLIENAIPTIRGNKITAKDAQKGRRVNSEHIETSSQKLESLVSMEKENDPSDVELKCTNAHEVKISDAQKGRRVDSEVSETSSQKLESFLSIEKENDPMDVELKCTNVDEVKISGETFETFSIRNLGDCVITIHRKA